MASREVGRLKAEVRALEEQMKEERARHAARGRQLVSAEQEMTRQATALAYAEKLAVDRLKALRRKAQALSDANEQVIVRETQVGKLMGEVEELRKLYRETSGKLAKAIAEARSERDQREQMRGELAGQMDATREAREQLKGHLRQHDLDELKMQEYEEAIGWLLNEAKDIPSVASSLLYQLRTKFFRTPQDDEESTRLATEKDATLHG